MKFKFTLDEKEVEKCKEFAENSAKTQRECRSGGMQKRSYSMIVDDTCRGKIGEMIVKKFLEQPPLNLKNIKLDFGIYPRGIWDSEDIIINSKKISIKSAKWFSQWLLLESKDIARGDTYDVYILILVDKDFAGGIVEGFAYKNEIVEPNSETKLLKQGDYIPGTNTKLDADNHARHARNLNNSEKDWKKLISYLKETH